MIREFSLKISPWTKTVIRYIPITFVIYCSCKNNNNFLENYSTNLIIHAVVCTDKANFRISLRQSKYDVGVILIMAWF